MSTVREPYGREMSAVGSRCQKAGKDTASWENLVRALVKCKV
jgi:hypothetical protein